MRISAHEILGVVAIGAVLAGATAFGMARASGNSGNDTSGQTETSAQVQSCAYSTKDGDYTVIVTAQGSVCGTIAQGLAGTGNYWSPDADVGVTGSPVCDLGSGDSAISVYNVATIDEPVSTGLAESVCSSQEQAGWIPQP